jgi:NTE family protein
VHFSLPAGEILSESGSIPDGVYLLASGRLGVRPAGSLSFAAEIAAGELVGEAGWLLQEPRSATVLALRDSELLWLPHAVRGRRRRVEQILARDRPTLRAPLATQHGSAAAPKRARVFALVPNSRSTPSGSPQSWSRS